MPTVGKRRPLACRRFKRTRGPIRARAGDSHRAPGSRSSGSRSCRATRTIRRGSPAPGRLSRSPSRQFDPIAIGVLDVVVLPDAEGVRWMEYDPSSLLFQSMARFRGPTRGESQMVEPLARKVRESMGGREGTSSARGVVQRSGRCAGLVDPRGASSPLAASPSRALRRRTSPTIRGPSLECRSTSVPCRDQARRCLGLKTSQLE